MSGTQFERDAHYLAALAIVKTLRRNGLVTDSEYAKIDEILAEKFSPSLAARMPKIACIK